ncbi:REP-associated tyrosine transposase [Gracilimonas mengyeensis]|uniref:Transposase IS200 like n=1 Tax=Gracilimonas mengyeensis TaxID=1302730 RepID=A0A521C2U3_9BACT|nr:transposase [Gracilimonas mengyeensis]SMO53655.1 Transposase IS200 like [Gracilimonas mengyeensis]
MGRSRYKFHEEYYPYFITSTILEELPLLSKPQIAQILLDQFIFMQKEKQVTLYAYVIMPNHFHAIVQGENLGNSLRLTKSYIARKTLEYLKQNEHTRWLNKLKWNKKSHKAGRTYQLWQEGSHPVQLNSSDMVHQKMEYLHANPVSSGFVDEPAD